MVKIIAVANQKGGVGKTTTAVNLAASLGVLEHSTLLIDIDPQANATSALGKDISSENSIYQLLIHNNISSNFKNISKDIIQKTSIDFLDIISSNINLVGAELELLNLDDREYRLKKILDAVLNGSYDSTISKQYKFIVIDCAPSLGLLTINALTAAHGLLIPVQCEYFALEGLEKLLNTVELVKTNFNKDLNLEGILMTMYDSRLKLANQIVREVKTHFNDKLFQTMIPRNVKLSEAPSFGKPSILYSVDSTGTINYLNLANEIIQKC